MTSSAQDYKAALEVCCCGVAWTQHRVAGEHHITRSSPRTPPREDGGVSEAAFWRSCSGATLTCLEVEQPTKGAKCLQNSLSVFLEDHRQRSR